MNKSNQKLVDDAKKLIDKVHADTSVDVHETFDQLKDIRKHVDDLIDAVASDLPEDD